ncbi:hypothetical protein V5N11_008901 [Cardamine amara subsp. amara]|uniref:Uncharacterized protein n=1 Tax=Cardamine amara subsp. amara TaxID=228776 RepID=A0ABD1A323_CARAN
MISADKSNFHKFFKELLSSGENTNLNKFLKCVAPSIPIQYFTQSIGSSSSSSSPGAEAEEVRKPRIVLSDIWSAYEEWSSYGLGVPLSLGDINSRVTQHYVPSLSAMQIFTIKPFLGDDSSSRFELLSLSVLLLHRSLSIGKDGAESSSANPDSSSNSRPGFLRPDYFGNLYLEYNETKMPFQRDVLIQKIDELAEQYTGLNSLTSSDLSRRSWFSVAWYPIYPIPAVRTEKKGLSAAFLTYHSFFSETIGEDDKKNEQGVSSAVLSAFAAVTYKAHKDVWIMPNTTDSELMRSGRKGASSWLRTMGFNHSDQSFFTSRSYF